MVLEIDPHINNGLDTAGPGDAEPQGASGGAAGALRTPCPPWLHEGAAVQARETRFVTTGEVGPTGWSADSWENATVIRIDGNGRVLISYDGWGKAWNDTLAPSLLRPRPTP